MFCGGTGNRGGNSELLEDELFVDDDTICCVCICPGDRANLVSGIHALYTIYLIDI